MFRTPPAFKLLGLFIVLFVLGTTFYDQMVNEPKAIVAQKALEQEYAMLDTLPNSTNVQHSSIHKPTHVLVSAYYTTDEGWEVIRTFYLQEAQKKGWTHVRTWSSKPVDFRKGEYYLSIAELPDRSFVVHLSWGLDK